MAPAPVRSTSITHPPEYVFASAISGNEVPSMCSITGITTFTEAPNSYSGTTNVDAGTLRAGRAEHVQPEFAGDGRGAAERALDLNGFNQTAVPGVINAGLVTMGSGTAPGTVLDDNLATSETGGTAFAMNTFLGGRRFRRRMACHQCQRSAKSVISSFPCASPSAGGPRRAETVANGIAGGAGDQRRHDRRGAFALAGEVRGGAFDYDLFRGGLGGKPSQRLVPPLDLHRCGPPEIVPSGAADLAAGTAGDGAATARPLFRSSGQRSRPMACGASQSPGNWG